MRRARRKTILTHFWLNCHCVDDSDEIKRFKDQNDERNSEWNQGLP